MQRLVWCLAAIIVLTPLPLAATDYSLWLDRSALPPEAVMALQEITLSTTGADLLRLPQEIGAAVGQGAKLLLMLKTGQISAADFSEWVAEQEFDESVLISALDGISLSYPMKPTYQPLCTAVFERLGDKVETYLDFPPQARALMAIHFGLLGREDDTRALLSSLSGEQQKTRLTDTYWSVASELLRQRRGLRAAIWAWKTGARIREDAAAPAYVCLVFRLACGQLDDPQVVREELIPWVEEALARPGSESQWHLALPALLWGYDYLGEPEKTIERGRYWLGQGHQRGVWGRQVGGAKLRIARALIETNEVVQAEGMLREIIAEGPEWLAEAAQIELLKLAQAHPELGEVEILPPRFRQLWPEELTLRLPVGAAITPTITVAGNSTFWVTGASCELPWVNADVGERKLDERGSTQRVLLSLDPPEKPGSYDTTLVIQTNDPQRATIQVSLSLEVLSPAP